MAVMDVQFKQVHKKQPTLSWSKKHKLLGNRSKEMLPLYTKNHPENCHEKDIRGTSMPMQLSPCLQGDPKWKYCNSESQHPC
uniref:Uncharacterized protein n=1 Tax=Nothoprocta perdicaria TaxID=30464 RepID=A0A8C6ZIQ6_NOTPE